MKQPKNIINIAILVIVSVLSVFITGCGEGYSNSWPYPEEVKTVYVEMFDSKSFRRDHEYDLTDAVCKRIESQTPYKIVSDRNVADSLLSGNIENINKTTLTMERKIGRPLENEARILIRVDWKNLQTGEMILQGKEVFSSATYSTYMGQDMEYAADLAVNKAAQKIVESMQNKF